MNQGDYLTYRKAANTAIIGLVIQLVLTLSVFFYAQSSGDDSAAAGTIFLLSGVLVWGVLLLVFDQHRRERIETMEAEQLAVTGAASARAVGASKAGAAALRVRGGNVPRVPATPVGAPWQPSQAQQPRARSRAQVMSCESRRVGSRSCTNGLFLARLSCSR